MQGRDNFYLEGTADKEKIIFNYREQQHRITFNLEIDNKNNFGD